jgi:hypothetical protein
MSKVKQLVSEKESVTDNKINASPSEGSTGRGHGPYS